MDHPDPWSPVRPRPGARITTQVRQDAKTQPDRALDARVKGAQLLGHQVVQRRRRHRLAVTLVRLAALAAQDLSYLQWRAVGPASFGGRIDYIEAVPGRPGKIFVG